MTCIGAARPSNDGCVAADDAHNGRSTALGHAGAASLETVAHEMVPVPFARLDPVPPAQPDVIICAENAFSPD